MDKYLCICFMFGLFILTGCQKDAVVMTAGTTGQSDMNYADCEKEEMQEEAQTMIYVYVCGKVQNPGVYGLEPEARICDALAAAGGVTADGVPETLSQAEHMTDGQTIYVPGADELRDSSLVEEDDGRIDINHADIELLMTLPGIGESKAKLILNYRQEHGNFQSIEDLMDIPGIKEGVFQKIKDSIKVSGS